MIGDDAITALLETFQGCKRRGEHATLFLETRNGNHVATFRVKAPAKGSKPGEVTTPRKKAPSAVRRDQQRLRTFLLKKSLQESLGSPVASSTPASRPGQFSSNQDIDIQVTMPETPEILEKENSASETTPVEQDLDHNESDKEKEHNKSSKVDEENKDLPKEEVERQLKKVIADANLELDKKLAKMLAKQDDLSNMFYENENGNENENDMDKENDNIEDAKQWALCQKQNFRKK